MWCLAGVEVGVKVMCLLVSRCVVCGRCRGGLVCVLVRTSTPGWHVWWTALHPPPSLPPPLLLAGTDGQSSIYSTAMSTYNLLLLRSIFLRIQVLRTTNMLLLCLFQEPRHFLHTSGRDVFLHSYINKRTTILFSFIYKKKKIPNLLIFHFVF